MKNLNKVPIGEIKAAAKGHFFDADTMRFFRSAPAAYGFRAADGAIYFATTEQFVPSRGKPFPRRASVRVLDAAGNVSTVGDFQGYETLRAASLAARAIATAQRGA
ncbi:MAG: hypothetical protein MUE39_09350 [Gammaproteobacteria bacterium]|jgi:hypothetical protein|nr:hypothetical protein [Gammaproteobacteria bacterium]